MASGDDSVEIILNVSSFSVSSFSKRLAWMPWRVKIPWPGFEGEVR